MELQLPVLRALAVVLLALQCSIFSVRGLLPAERERYYREDEDSHEDRYYDDEADYYDEDWGDNGDDDSAVLLLSPLTGRFVVSTEDGLKSDGGSPEDPLGLFVRTEVSPSTITLMTQDQQLLGINSKGQILLDARNSSDIFHEFEEVKDDDDNLTRLQVHIDGADCYVAFTKEGYPVRDACLGQSE